MHHVLMNFFILETLILHNSDYFFQMYYSIYSLYGNAFDHLFMFFLLCRRGNNHFDVHFGRIGPYFFLSKDGKDAVREGRN